MRRLIDRNCGKERGNLTRGQRQSNLDSSLPHSLKLARQMSFGEGASRAGRGELIFALGAKCTFSVLCRTRTRRTDEDWEWTGANGKRLCPAKKETLTTAGWETKKSGDEIDFCRQKRGPSSECAF